MAGLWRLLSRCPCRFLYRRHPDLASSSGQRPLRPAGRLPPSSPPGAGAAGFALGAVRIRPRRRGWWAGNWELGPQPRDGSPTAPSYCPALFAFRAPRVTAEGTRNLRKLCLLYMNHVAAIGDGITRIVRSVSDELSEFEEIQLINYCISSAVFEKEHLQNLQHLDLAMNCVRSDGWPFMQPLISLRKLVSVDFSSKQDGVPASLLVCKLSQVLTTLNYLKEIKVTGWMFDCDDLGLINGAKTNCRKQFQLGHY
ncbi:LOW QUALITY PROTEIN: NLR family CARD domain-containing protein 4 [Chlamydotis macqueenii]